MKKITGWNIKRDLTALLCSFVVVGIFCLMVSTFKKVPDNYVGLTVTKAFVGEDVYFIKPVDGSDVIDPGKWCFINLVDEELILLPITSSFIIEHIFMSKDAVRYKQKYDIDFSFNKFLLVDLYNYYNVNMYQIGDTTNKSKAFVNTIKNRLTKDLWDKTYKQNADLVIDSIFNLNDPASYIYTKVEDNSKTSYVISTNIMHNDPYLGNVLITSTTTLENSGYKKEVIRYNQSGASTALKDLKEAERKLELVK